MTEKLKVQVTIKRVAGLKKWKSPWLEIPVGWWIKIDEDGLEVLCPTSSPTSSQEDT